MDNYEKIIEEEIMDDENNSNLSLYLGLGLIAGGGALAVEGGKGLYKLGKAGWAKFVTPRIEAKRAKKEQKEAAGEIVSENPDSNESK